MPYTFDQAASLLHIGRNMMTRELRKKGVLDSTNKPQGRYSGVGFFVVANGSYKHPNPEKGKVAYQKTLVTDKGLDLIERLLTTKPETQPTIH
jgi:phage antirepressor YoqD-like protein